MGDYQFSLVRGIRHQPKAAASANVVVVEVRDLGGPGVISKLEPFLEQSTRPPVVLVTSPNPENTRFLRILRVEELVWNDEPEEAVVAKCINLDAGSERRRIARQLTALSSSSPTIGLALLKTFAGQQPISSVRDLARDCFVGRRTLERKWKAARPIQVSASLKVLVGWSLLLRAWEMKKSGLTGSSIAKTLKIHWRTLDRTSYRLAGIPAGDFLNLDTARVREEIERRLLRSRLETDPDDSDAGCVRPPVLGPKDPAF